MSNPPIIFGLGGVVAGIFIGVAIGGSMVTDKINAAVTNAMERAQQSAGDGAAATQEAILLLGERVGAIETSLSERTAATQGISDAVRAQLDQMRDSLGGQFDTVRQSVSESSAELRAALDGFASGGGAGMQSGSAGGDTAAQASGDMPVTEGAGMSARVGETVLFADGAVRAFVSRVDAEGGMARISVNGALSSLAVGEAVTASVDGSDCSVALTAVEASSATLNSDCGGAAGGASGGDAAAADAAPADIPAAPEEGFRAGQTVQLAEGLRVFVSALAEDRSSARIAVNGLTMQSVAAGDSVEVPSGDRTCTITVTGVGDNIVGLEGSCG